MHPLQYSCLDNFIDRGAWRATVYEVAKTEQLTLSGIPTSGCIPSHQTTRPLTLASEPTPPHPSPSTVCRKPPRSQIPVSEEQGGMKSWEGQAEGPWHNLGQALVPYGRGWRGRACLGLRWALAPAPRSTLLTVVHRLPLVDDVARTPEARGGARVASAAGELSLCVARGPCPPLPPDPSPTLSMACSRSPVLPRSSLHRWISRTPGLISARSAPRLFPDTGATAWPGEGPGTAACRPQGSRGQPVPWGLVPQGPRRGSGDWEENGVDPEPQAHRRPRTSLLRARGRMAP